MCIMIFIVTNSSIQLCKYWYPILDSGVCNDYKLARGWWPNLSYILGQKATWQLLRSQVHKSHIHPWRQNHNSDWQIFLSSVHVNVWMCGVSFWLRKEAWRICTIEIWGSSGGFLWSAEERKERLLRIHQAATNRSIPLHILLPLLLVFHPQV